MSEGFVSLVSAMPLAPIDELSDDGKPVPEAVAKPKAKSATGKKVLPMKRKEAEPTAEPKAKAKVAAKAKAKETVASGSSKTVKRPAASKPAAKPAATSGATAPDGKKRGPPKKDITVGKGPYKNGTYGFKINGAQKMLVGSSVRYE